MPAADPSDPRPQAGRLARHVLDVVQRHPGAALPVDLLHELVALEGPDLPPRPEDLLRSLSGREVPLHLLVPRKRRWAGLAPRPWILARAPAPARGGHPILEGLRETLRRLGMSVNADSSIQMARWERYLIEEAEVHRAIRRRLRRLARGRQRSTTLPRDRPR